ncbi:MAG: alkyl sulfatase dimerization domain-containing protein [Gammaproteobacteria bacterium]
MADLFALSSQVVDTGSTDHLQGPINRISQELSELGNGIAVVESFSHSVLFSTDAGLVVFDASGAGTGQAVVESIRRWSKSPFHTVVYTHGHLDHIGGSGSFLADARAGSGPDPCFIGHDRVRDRIHRYRMTDGYNQAVNNRQFKGFTTRGYGIGAQSDQPQSGASRMTDKVPPMYTRQYFVPPDVVEPNLTYRSEMSLNVGGLEIELHHSKGETDDHTWAWIPKSKAICAGDFFIWNFPNCGNPQKVQRYPAEWASALRSMLAKSPEILLPAHGLPIIGKERIHMVLNNIATVLETLVKDSLELMNQGATLDDLLHQVKVPADELEKPWLRPLYDEPEFVVRNIWRLYGGWYDGNPSHLKPAPFDALAQEVAALSGGAYALCQRAQALSDAGDHKLACHLIEMAASAEADNLDVQEARVHIYQQRRDGETSLMAKGIFGTAANDSRKIISKLTNQ